MKKFPTRIAALSGAAVLAAVGVTACGSDDDGGSGGGDAAGKIAFLMPDRASTRYEEQDSPLFKKKVAELCDDCEVLYQNADSDPAKQQQQVESMIAQGVKVIVLDAVDSKAAAAMVTQSQGADIPIVTYDRPVTDVPADFYVSFDNEAIGRSIAESLVKHLESTGATGGVLMVNGSPTDRAAGLIKQGAEDGVGDTKVLASFDTPEWDPQKAQDWVSGQITKYRDQIAGVVAANDGTASGSIAALKAAGVTPLPPVTGNDAEVAAIQRVIAGDQFNTISKPIKTVADAAAEVAVALMKGEEPEATTELFDTPSQLFEPTVVTQENVKEVIFDGGIYTAEQICTAEYAAACAKLQIQ